MSHAAAAFSTKIHEGQHRMWLHWLASKARIYVGEVSARWGKSTFCVCACLATGLSITNGFIRYAAPTQKMVHTIITPLIRERTEAWPKEARPRYNRQDGCWRFPTTGTEWWIAGCDNGNAEHLRGVATDLFVVDEAGYIDEVDYVVNAILLPRTITRNGRGLVMSTPPKSPAHPFTFIAEAARAEDAYYHGTIHEATHITDADIAEYCRLAGGPTSTTWRREYLAQRVVDSTLAVVPEFIEHEKNVVAEWETPPFRDCYVAMDPAFTDLTACVFAYWDFEKSKIIVEDELELHRATTNEIAAGIALKEAERWGAAKPFLRVSDVDLRLIHDLQTEHKLNFTPTDKDDKDAALNGLRLAIARGEIVIHPRCKKTIAHLRTAIWNKSRTSFERATGFGHFDFVDALVYLVRNVQRAKNPYPAFWHGENHETHWMRKANPADTKTGRALRGAFANRLRRSP